jgi:hypothetical protein
MLAQTEFRTVSVNHSRTIGVVRPAPVRGVIGAMEAMGSQINA